MHSSNNPAADYPIDHLSPEELVALSDKVQTALARREPDVSGSAVKAPKASKIFRVPDSVKHLSAQQVEELESAFKAWLDAAADARTKLSRSRVWLVFLILRYTGMRLGEVLELDDRTDIDLAKGVITVSGEGSRVVPIPEALAGALREFFDAPMSVRVRGEVFRLDQGYIRRKFSERAKDTTIPRELLNPRVLRHSRAVEMLRGGVPLVVVDSMLGHKTQTSSAQYVEFSGADTQRIMQHYVQEVLKMKTSARNMFVGQVTSLRAGAILDEVEVTTASGLRIVSVITRDSFDNLGLILGQTVIATVKAPWVVLVKEDSQFKTSARNKFCGTISRINSGRISAEVVVDLEDGTKITSLVTDESVIGLDLKVGDSICALVKAFSVILSLE